MPSPFPGMDPYLEDPALWPGVHHELASRIRNALAPLVRPSYFVDSERRVYILGEEDPARTLIPDVSVSAGKPGPRAAPAGGGGGGGPLRPIILQAIATEEIREPRIVIRSARDRVVVTVIEILSPTNKTAGSSGRTEYLAKRGEVLASQAHLVEIDLLRYGKRVPTPQPLPACDYAVHVSRVEMRPRGEFYLWTIRDLLPSIPVPLRGEDEVPLDLGGIVRPMYDALSYDLELDYARPPVPPLGPEDEAWARERIAASGRGG